MLKVLKYLFPISLYGGDDEEKTPPTEKTDDPAPIPSAEEVLDIKNKFIKKEDYNKLQENYNKLIKSVIDGEEIKDNPSGDAQSPKASELRKELYNPDNSLSNLEYVQKTLQLRNQILAEGKPDPFLPAGINGDPFKSDMERQQAEQTAAKVAKVLQEAVDEADGNAENFDIILAKIIK